MEYKDADTLVHDKMESLLTLDMAIYLKNNPEIIEFSSACDNCRYLKGKRCKLWEFKVSEPDNSHCESWQIIKQTTKQEYSL